MILTRCSFCGTAFRVNPEQLRLRHGQVRCGHCQAIFNALDLLEEGQEFYDLLQKTTATPIPEVPVPTLDPIPPVREGQGKTQSRPERKEPTVAAPLPKVGGAKSRTTPTPTPPPMAPLEVPPKNELVNLTPRVSRRWPYVLITLIFSCLLLGQLAYAYRTLLVSHYPVFSLLFKTLRIPVPLARVTELVTIDSSDLEIDKERHQYLFMATLKNQASYPQDWPLLELALTDAKGTPLTRRVLSPADYLPPQSPRAFEAQGEMTTKLWLSAKGVNARSYSLYLFYP